MPEDYAERGVGKGKQDFKRRAVKITSYIFNGVLTAYAEGPPTLLTSKFKLGNLRTTGILLWEGPESEDDFLFNDVSNSPHEGISQRHASARRPKDQKEFVGGIAPLGSLSGAAYTVKMEKWFSPQLAGKNVGPWPPIRMAPTMLGTTRIRRRAFTEFRERRLGPGGLVAKHFIGPLVLSNPLGLALLWSCAE